jgi:hypothetical protein
MVTAMKVAASRVEVKSLGEERNGLARDGIAFRGQMLVLESGNQRARKVTLARQPQMTELRTPRIHFNEVSSAGARFEDKVKTVKSV